MASTARINNYRTLSMPKATKTATKHISEPSSLVVTEGLSAFNVLERSATRAGHKIIHLQGRYFPTKNFTQEHPISRRIMDALGLRHGMVLGCGGDCEELRIKTLLILAIDQDPNGGFLICCILNFLRSCWPALFEYPEFFKVYVLKSQCVDRLMKEFTSVASLPKHIVQEFFKNSDDFLIHLRPDETMHSLFTIITKRKLNSLKEFATQNIEKTQDGTISSEIARFYSAYYFRRNEQQLPSAVDGLTPMRRAILTALARESPDRIVDADLLAAQVRYMTKYKARTADIARSIVAMSNEDIKQPAVSYLVRGCRNSQPYYCGIKCVGKLITSLYPPDEVTEGILPIPVIPLHLIQGWNHTGVGMKSRVKGSRAVVKYLTSKIDGMLHKKERTYPPPSMIKETFVIDEDNKFKSMTIFKMFNLYFQRRLEKYKEQNGGSEEQALKTWKLAIESLLNNYAAEEEHQQQHQPPPIVVHHVPPPLDDDPPLHNYAEEEHQQQHQPHPIVHHPPIDDYVPPPMNDDLLPPHQPNLINITGIIKQCLLNHFSMDELRLHYMETHKTKYKHKDFLLNNELIEVVIQKIKEKLPSSNHADIRKLITIYINSSMKKKKI